MHRDEQAFFETVYNDVFPILFKVVLRILGDPDRAEEVCHDAFIRFYQHSTSLPDGAQAKYWLLRVGKNLAYNVSKRRGREARANQRAWHEPQRVSESGDTAVLREETARIVHEAIERLPHNLRDVIVLKEYGGLSYNEIAKTLGISVTNVKVRVHRARSRLAEQLEEGDVHIPH
ncbi:MAG: RNA polymerase sigma factor [Spirochaeta sp.]|jgi:RNA polymerase sigma-70 factor (ECF subfamily)|nr:RNA polymerase sigma factor [Spirochaeta sp.]